MTAAERAALPSGPARRIAGFLARHRRVSLGLLLAPPVGWFGVIYFGALALLLVAAFWTIDPTTQNVVRQLSLQNLATLLTDPTYIGITLKTLALAALVTVTDFVLAFPLAFYMARIAAPRTRNLLVVLLLMPLWSSYLVKVYAWRVILQPNGPLDWLAQQVSPGGLQLYPSDAAVWITLSYLWLPYMVIPIYAGLERIPGSLLEASADLGGHALTTFRRVIVPLALPAIVAGSIFTFSLSLGDYITPKLVSNAQFIGNVIYDNQGIANNLPFAAAYALFPIGIMAVYLLVARRLGAFDAL